MMVKASTSIDSGAVAPGAQVAQAVQQRNVREPKILFITTSLGTKWESYSQALIKLGYPSQKRKLVDGTVQWWSLKFLGPALEEDSDYTVYIDEDCFLYDPVQLDGLISYLDKNDDVVIAGVPDGGHYYRAHNPCACNLFFLVFKTRDIRQLLTDHPDWMGCKFKDVFKKAADLDITSLDESRIQYDDFEPYYGLFWAILESGKKIRYLENRLDPHLLSTDVYFSGGSTPLARHMWYLRSWNMSELGPYDKVPHRQRYLQLEQHILSLRATFRFRRMLWTCHLIRKMKWTARAITRRIHNIVYGIARGTNERPGQNHSS
jgi:hypothetical protein